MLYLSNQVDGIDGMETETFRLIRSSAWKRSAFSWDRIHIYI